MKQLKPNITAADHIENGLMIREDQAKRIAELEAALEQCLTTLDLWQGAAPPSEAQRCARLLLTK